MGLWNHMELLHGLMELCRIAVWVHGIASKMIDLPAMCVEVHGSSENCIQLVQVFA